MKSMVMFFALAAVACSSVIPQPAHHPAILLNPHGRPLDTAEVINNRAVHLQAKALESYGGLLHAGIAPIGHSVVAAPVVTAHATPLLGAGLLGHSALGLAGYGHVIGKRSLGHLAHVAPVIAPAAVSHQARLDVISSPAVVSRAVAAPFVAAHTSPLLGANLLGHSALGLAGHGHLIGKRSLGHLAHVTPVISSPVVTHAAVAPLAYAATAPLGHAALGHGAPLAHAGFLHSGHLAHGW